MRFRRRRAGGFRRGRRNPYEMQYAPFNRVALPLAGSASFNNPSVHLFLICHPRLEFTGMNFGDTDTPLQEVPAINRGCVVKGIWHQERFVAVPELNETSSSLSIGAVSIRWAIQRLPTQSSDGAPLLVPNLYQTTTSADVSGGDAPNVRTLFQQGCEFPMVDGTVSTDLASRALPEQLITTRPSPVLPPQHIKTAVRLSMDQGLFLNIQMINPFTVDIEGMGFTSVITLNADFRFGVKPILFGPNQYA